MTIASPKAHLITGLTLAVMLTAHSAVADDHAMAKASMLSESALATVPAGSYGLDKGHAYLNFSYSHLGFSTPTVGFRDFDVELSLDNKDISKSTLNVTVNVDSIDSRVEKFDQHLVSEDMFNTAEYPTATFTSSAFTMTSPSTAEISGDLTIKDTTRPVTLQATINKAANHPMLRVPVIGVSASASIKRSDFGVSYALPHVGDEIDIRIEVELPKAQ